MTEGNELVVEAVPAATGVIPESQPRYDRVGGWLLFFCVTLVILNPLTTLGFTAYGVLSLLPMLGDLPAIVTVVTVLDSALSLSLMGFSLYAGISLWSLRPGAVRIAKAFLIAGAIYTVVSPLLWLLPGVPRDTSVSTLEGLLDSWRGLLYFAIWLNYLRMSKRVKATYGDASAPA